uniref:Putative cAMP-specific phosphodiesterase n=1 Tax=Trypanosoma vivax (strain Y486) TaxID=1055687 RepID=G0U2D5_TRYVY|nr:putative cAMP-specific phosphodiesterase [Trypanosoma vivax Y486]
MTEENKECTTGSSRCPPELSLYSLTMDYSTYPIGSDDLSLGEALFNGRAPARSIVFNRVPWKKRVENFSIMDNNPVSWSNAHVKTVRDEPMLQDPGVAFSAMNNVMHQTLKYVKEVESIDFSIDRILDFNGEIMKDTRRIFLSVCASVFANFSFCSWIDMKKFLNFLSDIYEKYSEENSYHNSIHAADSLQMIFLILREKPAMLLFTDDEVIISFLATLCLSLVHSGVTNAFMARIDHPLSLVYGDITTQQSASLTAFIYLINREENRFIDLSCISATSHASYFLRELLVETVLATAPRMRSSLIHSLQTVAQSNAVMSSDVHVLISSLVILADNALAFRPRLQFINWARLLCTEWLREACEEERRAMDPLVPDLRVRINEDGLGLASQYCRVWLKPLASLVHALVPQDLYDHLERNSERPDTSESVKFGPSLVTSEDHWSDRSLAVIEILHRLTTHAKSLDRKASKRAILNATSSRQTGETPSRVSSTTASRNDYSSSVSPERAGGSQPSRCEHYFSFLRLYDIYERDGRPAAEFIEQLVFLAMQLNPDYIGSYAREVSDVRSKEECGKVAKLILEREEAPTTADVIASPTRSGKQTDGFILCLMQMYMDRDTKRDSGTNLGAHSSAPSNSRRLLHCSNPVYGGAVRGKR